MCCCGASLDAGSSSARLADLCLCAAAPQSSGLCVLAADGPSLGRHGSRSESVPPSPHRPAASPAHPAARPAAHTCSLPLAPGTQGGQRADPTLREEKGSNPTQSLCTAQGCSELALLDPIWGKIVLSSHDLPTPAPGCTPARISRSDPASLSWSSMHSLDSPHTAVCDCLEGLLSPLPPPHRAVPLREPPASLSPTCGTVP